MLAEDTAGHREIFGDDGDEVAYFNSPERAPRRARERVTHPAERRRLALAMREHMARANNSYRDRQSTTTAATGMATATTAAAHGTG